MPGGDQEADDRLVGADRRRVLRLLGGDRVDVDHRRGVAGASRFGRQADGVRRYTSSTRTATSCHPGSPARSTSKADIRFEYLNDATKTAASRDNHGWVTVGDVGYLDEEGYLFLTDRRHHMIISGGVNIYPQEAENLLVTHPKVLDAAVFGIPDDEMGQRVDGGGADRRPGRCHRRIRRGAARLAARPPGALQMSAINRVRERSCRAPTPASSTRTG